jgi:hypothetical protein
MANHMPLRNVVLDSKRVDAVRQSRQVIATVRLAWRFSQSWKVYRKTGEASAHLVNDAVPQETTGRNPVNEKNRSTGTAAR